jgi:hypothetical protein
MKLKISSDFATESTIEEKFRSQVKGKLYFRERNFMTTQEKHGTFPSIKSLLQP